MRKILLVVVLVINSLNVNSQSKSELIGEINPSMNLGKFNGLYDIIDFDEDLILTLGLDKSKILISIMDITKLRLGKISIKQKVEIPYNISHNIEQFKGVDINKLGDKRIISIIHSSNSISYVIIDYSKKEMSLINSNRTLNYKKFRSLKSTNKVYLNSEGELVTEFKDYHRSSSHYQVHSADGSVKYTGTKIKNLVGTECFYVRDLSYVNRGNEKNLDCAFKKNMVKAKARRPYQKGDKDFYYNDIKEGLIENPYYFFVDFYIGDYIENKKNKSFIYTYKHNCKKDFESKNEMRRIENAYISSDLKYVLVNNKYLYSLPKIEIEN